MKNMEERIEAIEKQVQDLKESRAFIRVVIFLIEVAVFYLIFK